MDLLAEDSTTHFLVVGVTGSGKTLTLRLLQQSVLSGMRADEDRRAIIYDPKRDTLPFLHALGLAHLTYNLNAFDRRSVAWDIAADLDSPAAIEQFAAILIPAHPGEHSPFFTDAARILLRCTITVLHAISPGAWSLRDVILIMSDPKLLEVHLARNDQTRSIASNLFEAKEFPSVISTIETRIRPYEVIAALWERTAARISIRRDWINRGSILLVGSHPAYSRCLGPINRAIYQYASDAMLSLPNSATRRSWVFLDEAREAGKIDGLRTLLTQGREKGICVAIGFQDIQGMWEVYGRNAANELVEQCNHLTFLRVVSPETATWMESHVNRALLRSRSTSRDEGMGKSSTTETLRIDHVMVPSEFLAIPGTSMQYGMKGFHLSSRIPKPYWTDDSLSDILGQLPQIPGNVPGEEPRPSADQVLTPWTMEDSRRLGLPSTTSTCVGGVAPQTKSESDAQSTSHSAADLLRRVRRSGAGPSSI